VVRTHTRRSFLDWLLGTTLLAWLASIVYPVVRYLTPLPEQVHSGPARLTRGDLNKLDEQSFAIVPLGRRRVLVFRDSDQKLHALSAKCTHEGCTVRYVAAESVVWCACHNGRFDSEGRVISGPPPRPLPPYVVTKDADGNVFVAAEKA